MHLVGRQDVEACHTLIHEAVLVEDQLLLLVALPLLRKEPKVVEEPDLLSPASLAQLERDTFFIRLLLDFVVAPGILKVVPTGDDVVIFTFFKEASESCGVGLILEI
mmetsp:Transcript_25094/g.24560  ORF Transcript_25094/g.24560 Transcript_25094/m.24560 type:complete len:107 (-) Transcript_25094:685-1005(-)